MPPLDQGVAALLDDLSASGLLEETLVVMLGEFGRTPKISKFNGKGAPGRDHWGPCFSAVFAGAGVQGGQVIGKTDKNAAYPVTVPYSPADLAATVYRSLGVPFDAEIGSSSQGREVRRLPLYFRSKDRSSRPELKRKDPRAQKVLSFWSSDRCRP